MGHSFPLPTRIHRLGLRLRPLPTFGSPLVQFSLRTVDDRSRLSDGHPRADALTAQLSALASHPLGQAALWPPHDLTLCMCPACHRET